LYPKYEDSNELDLMGSIPSNNAMCASAETSPLLIKFVKVIPCFWMRSK
jgi:hypothetical protein